MAAASAVAAKSPVATTESAQAGSCVVVDMHVPVSWLCRGLAVRQAVALPWQQAGTCSRSKCCTALRRRAHG
jgi:hypothetical protein